MLSEGSVRALVDDAAHHLADAGVESPLLDAQLLMAHAIGCTRLDIIAHPERMMSEPELARFSEALKKRLSRFPLAYILGHREFYGLEMTVAPGVLIPRPETELLVEETLNRLKGISHPVVADIGAGSGAIAVALASNLSNGSVCATEISPEAINVAEANIQKHSLGERARLLKGNFSQPLAEAGLAFDAIVSNPPYIPSADIYTLEPEVKDYEPCLALDGGADGLDAYRRLFPESFLLLKAGGFIAVEIGIGEAEAVQEIAEGAGYHDVGSICDLAGIERVVVGYK